MSKGRFKTKQRHIAARKPNLSDLSCLPKESGRERIIGSGLLLVNIGEWTKFDAPFNLDIFIGFFADGQSIYAQNDDGRSVALSLHLERQSMVSYRISYYGDKEKTETIGELRMIGEATPIRNSNEQIDQVRFSYTFSFAETGKGRLVITVNDKPFPPPAPVIPGAVALSAAPASRVSGFLKAESPLDREQASTSAKASAFSLSKVDVVDVAANILHNYKMSSPDPNGESTVATAREQALEAEVSDLKAQLELNKAQLEQNTAALIRLTEVLEATAVQKLNHDAGSPAPPWSRDELAAWTEQLKRRGEGTDWKAFSEELRQEND